MYVPIHNIHILTHILTTYRTRKSFTTRSFIFNMQNKSFHDRVCTRKEGFKMYVVCLLPYNQ